jgi:hypothetical protein
MRNRKGSFLYGDFMNNKLRKDSWCAQCVGCNRLKESNFIEKNSCNAFRAAEKKVWCADEAVNKFIDVEKARR